MKSLNLSVLALSGVLSLGLAAGPAGAQDKTREQVKAEARAAAQSPAGKGEADCPSTEIKSTKSRDQVKAETVAAAKSGQLARGDEGCANPAAPKTSKPRAEVKAEAREAAKSPAGKGEADIRK
jgi:hypothetical protein